MKFKGIAIDWLGYSTIRIEPDGGDVFYLDPGRVRFGVLTDCRPMDADHVLITHTHHYDPVAIHRVATAETEIHMLKDVVGLNNTSPVQNPPEIITPSELVFDVTTFECGAEFEVGNVAVRTVPAYHLPSPEGLSPKANGERRHPPGTNVGLHLTVAGVRLFWPSDSDFVEEHRDLDVDVLLPPISQVVTMNRHDAVELAKAVEPELVIPVHYSWKDKTPDGRPFLVADPEAFRADVEELGIRCEVI